MLNINTDKIHRLRDALLATPQSTDVNGSKSGSPHQVNPDLDAMLARIEPFAETLYLMMIIDGETDTSELTVLHSALSVLSGGVLNSTVIDQLLQRFEQNAQQGVEYRLQVIGSHLCANQVDREIAFKLAATVALADDSVESIEQSFLQSIAEWYGISSKRAHAILDDL